MKPKNKEKFKEALLEMFDRLEAQQLDVQDFMDRSNIEDKIRKAEMLVTGEDTGFREYRRKYGIYTGFTQLLGLIEYILERLDQDGFFEDWVSEEENEIL